MEKDYQIHEVEADMIKYDKKYSHMIGFRLRWIATIGFGELNFYYDTKNKTWEYDTECMDKAFCAAVLEKWLENMMK